MRLFGLGLLPPSSRKPRALRTSCLKTLKSEKADARGELNIIFLDRKRMRNLNRRYLGRDHDTDVIAFNYPAPLRKDSGDEPPFGDIFISAHQARKQAKELGHPVLTEVLTLIIHGTLHLLGYEDSTPGKKARMFRKQEILLRSPRVNP